MTTTPPAGAGPVAQHEAALAAALETFAEVFGDAYLADDVGARFTCYEADAVAQVLSVSGYADAAETWLDGHSLEDEEGDKHVERRQRVEEEARQRQVNVL